MKAVLNYISEKSDMTYGINCSDNHKEVYKEFIDTKNYHKKIDGRQYRHYIQSFNHGEVDKEKAMNIGIEWAKKSFAGYEVYLVTHTDRDHIHNHVIVNSVNFENGSKFHETKKELEKRKELNDEICLKHGLKKIIPEKEKGQVITYDKEKYQIIKKGADITKLAQNIIEVHKISLSVNDFSDKLEKKGYHTEWTENKKHVTFTVDPKILEGKKNKFRLANLKKTFNMEIFEKEYLLKQFIKNKENTFSKLSQNLDENSKKISM